MAETILLVDDEEGIRRFLGLSLKDLGYTVHTAQDAAEALEIFAAVRPPIVLTDIKMPGMDGIELLQRLKRDPVSMMDMMSIIGTKGAVRGAWVLDIQSLVYVLAGR